MPAPDGVLARLARVRRHGERQLDLQRSRLALFGCLGSDRDPERLAAAILEFAMEQRGAGGGAFYLGRPAQRLVRAADRGLAPDGRPPRELRLGLGLIGRLAAQRRPRVLAGHRLPTACVWPASRQTTSPAARPVCPSTWPAE